MYFRHCKNNKYFTHVVNIVKLVNAIYFQHKGFSSQNVKRLNIQVCMFVCILSFQIPLGLMYVAILCRQTIVDKDHVSECVCALAFANVKYNFCITYRLNE